MKKRVVVLFLSMFVCCACSWAQEAQKSDLQERAEAEAAKDKKISARSLYILAYEDYTRKGLMQQGVECGVKATALYYGESAYQEAFDLLRNIDQSITASSIPENRKAALRYLTAKERMTMYVKFRKADRALEQIDNMGRHATAAGDAELQNDWLYNKAIYFYTFGQNALGNAVFKEMAAKLTAAKDYDKVEAVYKTLISNGRKSGSASLVAQAYDSYIVWKDSVNALKMSDERQALKQQITALEASIVEKNEALASRQRMIAGLYTLAAVLAAVLVAGFLLLLRFFYLTRRQKRTIRIANDNNAKKAHFISNISSQMAPALAKLDGSKAEVRALQDFTRHIQLLSKLETTLGQTVPLEEVAMKPFCEDIMNQLRSKAPAGVILAVDAPQMSAPINKEYVSHVLLHLLNNALSYVPADGHVRLEFKKRGAHTHQFQVSNTGAAIPEEQREEVFKPFRDIRDLTTGDGLGLPICRLMATKMNGELTIDPEFTKGTRFILKLHTNPM